MEVVVVDLRDVRIRDNNEREVSEGLDSMCESNWEEREGEVCRRKQRVGREWRSSVP